jgi:flagellar hook-associated protein 3 FlgL
MRISTVWSQQSSLNAMLQQQVKLTETQLQLSTGLKILKPSDDPVATTRILAFNDEITQTQQYQRNIDTARERNIIQESSLYSAENLLFRAKELTIQAANDTLNANDRLSIKQEIDQLTDNLLSLSNTQNANGEYIFSGYQSNTKPFAFDPLLNAYEAYGEEDSQRLIQISPERRIADGELGFDIFHTIESNSQEANAAATPPDIATRSIFNTLLSLSEALASTFTDPQATIQGPTFINTPVDFSAGTTFDIISDTTPPLPPAVPVPITVSLTGSYDSIDDLVAAINDPANNLNAAGIEAHSNGNYLEFVSLTPGASSTIEISNMIGDFGLVTGFTNPQSDTGVDLQTNFEQAVSSGQSTINQSDALLQTITDEVLIDLDNALESFLHGRTAIGARLNALDIQETQNEKFILDLQTTLSDIEDLDYAEAISRFNIQNTVLQAAQQSFTRVQNLSLFNFL